MTCWKPLVRGPMGRRTLLPVIAAVTLLAACGNDGTAGGSGGGSNLPGSPIVIGALVNVTGPGNDSDKRLGEILEAWVAHTNENGGIAGHPVEVRVEDTRNDASNATTLAEQFVADESVVAVMMGSTAIEGAVSPVLAEASMPVGGFGYNPQVWSVLPNFHTTTTTHPQQATAQIASVVDVGASTMAALVCAENPNCLAVSPLYEDAAERAGVDYTGTIQVSASAPNYTAECLQVIDNKVDFLILSVNESTFARIVTDCRRQGYQGWFGASGGSLTPGLYNEVADLRLAGYMNGFPWWLDTEPVQEFRVAMQEQGVSEETYGAPPSTGMWAAAELFRAALSGVGPDEEVTRETVQQGYGSLQGETLGGLLPMPVSYTPGQPAPKVPCYWLYRYENDTFSGAEQPTCETTTS